MAEAKNQEAGLKDTRVMRQQILDSATSLFANRGVSGTSLQLIADSVNIRKASLLYYFKSKVLLREAVLAQLLDRWNDDLPKLLHAATTGASRFDSVITAVFSFFKDNPDRARLLVREILDQPVAMEDTLRNQFAPWVQLVADYIRRGQKEGTIYSDLHPESYVIQVLNLMLSTLAMIDVVAALHPEDRRQTLYMRQETELMRLTRTALFIDEQKQNISSLEASDDELL